MDEQTAAAIKEGAHATWASGNFDDIAKLIWPVGAGLADTGRDRAGPAGPRYRGGHRKRGDRGGRTRGARVTASDLTPELFVAGRANAEAAGVELEWIEADAEALPFEDDSFDVVLSTFGIMFAPRQEIAAAEAVRVLRPGGRFGFCCWKPDGRHRPLLHDDRRPHAAAAGRVRAAGRLGPAGSRPRAVRAARSRARVLTMTRSASRSSPRRRASRCTRRSSARS